MANQLRARVFLQPDVATSLNRCFPGHKKKLTISLLKNCYDYAMTVLRLKWSNLASRRVTPLSILLQFCLLFPNSEHDFLFFLFKAMKSFSQGKVVETKRES